MTCPYMFYIMLWLFYISYHELANVKTKQTSKSYLAHEKLDRASYEQDN